MIKNKYIIIYTVVIASIGLIVGFYLSNFKYGYNYSVNAKKTYQFQYGKIEVRNTNKSIGYTLMNSNNSEIRMEYNDGQVVTLYDSQRNFQENSPHVETADITDGSINWDDGAYKYQLIILPSDKLKNNTNINEIH